MTAAATSPPLAVENLVVEFPGVRALDGVSVDFRAGEVHGVIGENGAGKSTLMKVLAGLQRPTRGRLLIDGEPATLRGAPDATARGIAMIHQELNLVGELSVAENLLLGREPRGKLGLIDRAALNAESRKWLAAVGADLHPRTPVRRLSVAQQQTVEIAKAVSQDARVIIMDEPTAVLGVRESEALFDLIRRLKGEGRTVIYISHRLAEVKGLCDRVTVLRDGTFVTTLDGDAMAAAGEAELASFMVGRSMGELSKHFPPRGPVGETVVFECIQNAVPPAVQDVTFAVRGGEIFGISGLIGSGRTEWAEGVIGLRKLWGDVRVDGKTVSVKGVRDAMRAGISYVSEDRKDAGLELEMSIAANTTLMTLKRYCNPELFGPLGFVDRKAEDSVAAAHGHNLKTKYARLRDPVSSLSGGNQQKVALAKALDASPRVLILDEPTRGVDIGAKEEIYRVIARLAAGGMACVVISSEMPELLGLCHRIGVMRHGRLAATLDAAEATEERIMQYAAGVAAA